MHEAPVAIADYLELDVMRPIDQFFDVDTAVPKRFLGFAASRMKSLYKTYVIVRSAHPSTATAGNRFDHHRVPNLFGNLYCLALRLNDSIAPGRDRHPYFDGLFPSSVLVAHHPNR